MLIRRLMFAWSSWNIDSTDAPHTGPAGGETTRDARTAGLRAGATRLHGASLPFDAHSVAAAREGARAGAEVCGDKRRGADAAEAGRVWYCQPLPGRVAVCERVEAAQIGEGGRKVGIARIALSQRLRDDGVAQREGGAGVPPVPLAQPPRQRPPLARETRVRLRLVPMERLRGDLGKGHGDTRNASASCLGAPSATSGAMSLPSSFESHLESGSCSATHAASRVTPLTRAAPDCSRFSA